MRGRRFLLAVQIFIEYVTWPAIAACRGPCVEGVGVLGGGGAFEWAVEG